jgi:small subunit ribosomal protein S21
MPKIEVRKGGGLEQALKKFKMKMRREGILDEVKKREAYEKPSQQRRQAEKAAVRREKKRQRDSE